ncbi:hypothetical protein [Calidifontibacter terrae]
MWTARRQAWWVAEVALLTAAVFGAIVCAVLAARAAGWGGSGLRARLLAETAGGFLMCAGCAGVLVRTRARRWSTSN